MKEFSIWYIETGYIFTTLACPFIGWYCGRKGHTKILFITLTTLFLLPGITVYFKYSAPMMMQGFNGVDFLLATILFFAGWFLGGLLKDKIKKRKGGGRGGEV